MAFRLLPTPHTLPNLRPIRRLCSAAGGGDGDGDARPPSPFSDIRGLLRSAPSPPGRIPDLSSFPLPPDPAAAGGEAGAARPPSLFSDIKDRLRSAPTPPRHLPDLPPPPPPPPLSPPPDSSLAADIRKHLAEFRSKTPHLSSASAPPTLSFQQLFKNNLLNNNSNPPSPSPAAPPPHTLSFDSIRDSLSKLQPGPPPATFPFSGFRYLHLVELGEKLLRLRPQGATAAGGQFSLAELNDRLVKLRELEEKEADSWMGWVSFRDLRNSLLRLMQVDAEKKASCEVNKYNHPDHMSSEEKMKLDLELKKVRDECKMSESDCGSTQVQGSFWLISGICFSELA